MRSKLLYLFVITIFIIACTPQTLPAVAPTDIATATPTAFTPTPTSTPSVVTGENGHTLSLVWQSEFSPQAALGAPVDIALDREGNLYVTTASIKKYDSEGKFVTQWGEKMGSDDGEFSLSTGIAADWQGNVYVDDFRNKRIQKFDSDGNYLMQWPTDRAGSPGSIVVDKDGNVFVSLFGSDDGNLQKFDPQGNLLLSWGGTGNGDGQFAGRIEDIAMDQEGNIYVTDSFNHRIQKFDGNGNFLLKFGSGPGTEGRGTFTNTRGVAVDTNGHIYVVDNLFLQKFDSQGNFVTQWSIAQGGELNGAGFLTIDEHNDLYILARSKVTNASGSFDVFFIKKFHPSE